MSGPGCLGEQVSRGLGRVTDGAVPRLEPMAQFDACADNVETQFLAFLLEFYPELRGSKRRSSILESKCVTPAKGSQHQLPVLTNTPLRAPSCSQQKSEVQYPQVSSDHTPCSETAEKPAINVSWSSLCPYDGTAPGRADLIGFVHLAAEAPSTRSTFLKALHGFYTHTGTES